MAFFSRSISTSGQRCCNKSNCCCDDHDGSGNGSGNGSGEINFPDLINVQVQNWVKWTKGLQIEAERKEIKGGAAGAAITLPAGAYSISIRNTSPNFAAITVNGETVSVNGLWDAEAHINYINNIQDFVQQVDIVIPPGGEIWYKAAYPSV